MYSCMNVWQSWVEVKHYSVPYFKRVTTFVATAVAQYFH